MSRALSPDTPDPAMESPEPLSSSHPRRRRASLSGKLLNLFSPKPKSPHEPVPRPRPMISHPQPLHSHISVRPKRRFLEASTDENEPIPSSPRPRSRPRLHSDSSVASEATVRVPGPRLHTPPRRDSRPLKSALKKSASENDASPAAQAGDSRAVLLARPPLADSRASNAANSTSTLTPHASDSKSKSKVVRRLKATSWMPFPTRDRSSPSLPPTEIGSPPQPLAKPDVPRPRRTVMFAEKESHSHLESGASSDDLCDTVNYREDVVMELDGPVPSCASISPSRKRKLDYTPKSDLNARLFTSQPSSPALTRTTVFTPVGSSAHAMKPPSARLPPNDEVEIDVKPQSKRQKKNDLDDVLSKHLPPLPTPAKFELPPPARTIVGGVADEIMKDYAKEKNASTSASRLRKWPTVGPSGVLRRFGIDIVPNDRHSIVWDGKESDTYAWGGTLVVRDAKPASYFYPRHSIQSVHIDFHTAAEPRSSLPSIDESDSDTADTLPKYEWHTSSSGQCLKRTDILDRLSASRGISVEPDYVFVQPDDPDGPCAWLVHFWVPVPLSLFARSEHRSFVCSARVTVGDWQTPRTVVPARRVMVGIESLKSERLLAAAVSGESK